MKFEELDKKIQDWLSSELITGIIIQLNDQLGTVGPEVRVIPQTTRLLVTGGLKPELFAQQLKKGLYFVEDKDITTTATSIKERILKPIATPLKSLYGIDISKVVVTPPPPPDNRPGARTMEIEGSISKAVPRAQPQHTEKVPTQQIQQTQEQLRARIMNAEGTLTEAQRLSQQQSSANSRSGGVAPQQTGGPHARMMEIQGSFAPVERAPKVEVKKMVDIKKPTITAPVGPTAQVTQIQGSFAPSTPTSATPAVAPTTTTPPPTKKPEKEADVLQTNAPIGLSEVMPQAPASQFSVSQQKIPQTPTPPAIRPRPTFVEDPSSAKPIPKQGINTQKKPLSFIEDSSSAKPPMKFTSTTPTNTMPHNVVKYQDEHPVVE